MKVQYASDMHLEFGANSAILREHPIIPVGDIIVLAGDIGYLDDEAMTIKLDLLGIFRLVIQSFILLCSFIPHQKLLKNLGVLYVHLFFSLT